MRITKKKAAVVIAISAVAMAGAGGAYAYWTTGGTGTGTGTTGNSTNFTVAQSGTLTNLVPGVGQTVTFTVTNPASYAQYLSSAVLSVNSFSQQAAPAKPACTQADISVSAVTIAAGDIVAGGTRNGTATVTLLNAATNQDNCKNITVPLTFTAS